MRLVRIIANDGVNTGRVNGQGLWNTLVSPIAAYWNWAGLAVEFPTTIVVVFHLAEIRQHLLIGPFGVAPRSPVVIILRNATVQHLPIDGARTAGGLAPRDGQPVLLWGELRHVAPVMRAIGGKPYIVAQLEVIGQVRKVGVIRPGLQQEHRCMGVLGQAGCHNTPRGAGANDNHIVPHQVRSSLALVVTAPCLTLRRSSKFRTRLCLVPTQLEWNEFYIDVIAWHSILCIQNTDIASPCPVRGVSPYVFKEGKRMVTAAINDDLFTREVTNDPYTYFG